MLVTASNDEIVSPEETSCYLSVVEDQKDGSVWYGHPLRISTQLADGTEIALTLSFTETAELFALLRATEAARLVRCLAEGP
jgi:hypothetical protein